MTTKTIAIRFATVADAERLAQIHDDSWRSAYRGIIPCVDLEKMLLRRGPAWWEKVLKKPHSYIVLDVAGQIAGYASFGRNRSPRIPFAGEIYELYLGPEYQGLGLGKHLFKAALTELARRKHSNVVVWCLEDNDPGCRFYKNVGGTVVAQGVEKFGSSICRKVAYGWSVFVAS
jgi:ribosomal protein S18 acetylase RimI-like enzyme